MVRPDAALRPSFAPPAGFPGLADALTSRRRRASPGRPRAVASSCFVEACLSASVLTPGVDSAFPGRVLSFLKESSCREMRRAESGLQMVYKNLLRGFRDVLLRTRVGHAPGLASRRRNTNLLQLKAHVRASDSPLINFWLIRCTLQLSIVRHGHQSDPYLPHGTDRHDTSAPAMKSTLQECAAEHLKLPTNLLHRHRQLADLGTMEADTIIYTRPIMRRDWQ